MKKQVWVIDLLRKQIMRCGNLATADRIVSQVFSRLKRDHGNPWGILFKAIQAARPLVHLKTIRVGKSSLSIPAVITARQQATYAIRWLVHEARIRKDKRTMVERLVAELSDAALHHRGGAVSRKVRLHQLAEKNLGNIRRK